MAEARSIEPAIREDLWRKMVFLAGPRQVGKTTCARQILAAAGPGIYLSWDNSADRREIRAARWPGGRALVVLDELHTWRTWKRWLKGEFDRHRETLAFLVTGSARLDVYRRGGDSLQGRYHHYRLHPFSVAEAEGRFPDVDRAGDALAIDGRAGDSLEALMAFGGFPEPFLAQTGRTHRRWQRDRLDRFFREDVRELDAVRDLSAIEHMAELLVRRVGSPLSLNSLREDLDVSHRAVTHWLDVLDYLYHVVRVRPFEGRRVRSLKRMPKAYLWDWSLVPERGPRFENLVAMHLLKFVHVLQDTQGLDVDLQYLRDRTGREVDFLVTAGKRPWFAVETKLADRAIDPSLRYFGDRLRIPHLYQVVLESDRDFVEHGIRCVPAARFLTALA